MQQFNESIKKVVKAINSAPPEQYTFVCESTPKHDGIIDERYDMHVRRLGKSSIILIHAGVNEVFLYPKQSLSLLAWLRQEEETLQQLAKEQE